MSELLDKYIDANLINKDRSWYYYNKANIGQAAKAELKLKEMIEAGEIENIAAPTPKKPEVKKKELKPVINPAITNNKELPEDLEELFKPMAASIGNIEHHKKGGRFKVFVFGIDTRLEWSNKRKLEERTRKILDSVPYVFRYNDRKSNVRSGERTFNEGWTVVSKKNVNPMRTGSPWLTVARDDTPDEDMFTVQDTVLCYADKKQYKAKHGKMNMASMLRTAKVADSRQETAERIASLDPEQSIKGYETANIADQAIAKEQLEKNKNFSTNEAEQYINNLNALGSKGNNVESSVEEMRKLVDSGKIGKTVISSKPMTIDEI